MNIGYGKFMNIEYGDLSPLSNKTLPCTSVISIVTVGTFAGFIFMLIRVIPNNCVSTPLPELKMSFSPILFCPGKNWSVHVESKYFGSSESLPPKLTLGSF